MCIYIIKPLLGQFRVKLSWSHRIVRSEKVIRHSIIQLMVPVWSLASWSNLWLNTNQTLRCCWTKSTLANVIPWKTGATSLCQNFVECVCVCVGGVISDKQFIVSFSWTNFAVHCFSLIKSQRGGRTHLQEIGAGWELRIKVHSGEAGCSDSEVTQDTGHP